MEGTDLLSKCNGNRSLIIREHRINQVGKGSNNSSRKRTHKKISKKPIKSKKRSRLPDSYKFKKNSFLQIVRNQRFCSPASEISHEPSVEVHRILGALVLRLAENLDGKNLSLDKLCVVAKGAKLEVEEESHKWCC
ncbi:hypothetical protein BHE74_00050116 [Ensete ventricosum]|nr:hypothetical protein BHE74_00050116 [Ensete ventricosum]